MKIVNILKYFSAFMLMSLSISCSDTSVKDSEVSYDLEVKSKLGVLDSNASQLKKEVFNKLLNKKPIKQSDITRLLIEEQVNYYNEDNSSSPVTVDAVANWIKDVSNVNRQTYSIEDIKVLYQLQKLKISEVKYNKKATSLPYIMNNKKLQCFSSTMLHQLVVRNHFNFKNMNSVVIYENGHVLSGYMKKENNNWKLVGIENTVKGKGIKKYNDLKDYEGKNIRVVDSELFALVEIFKNDMSNASEVAKQVLDLTAKKYNLDPKFNYNYDNISAKSFGSFDSNSSPLSFGYVYVEDGDQDIKEQNEINNSDDDDSNPGIITISEHGYFSPSNSQIETIIVSKSSIESFNGYYFPSNHDYYYDDDINSFSVSTIKYVGNYVLDENGTVSKNVYTMNNESFSSYSKLNLTEDNKLVGIKDLSATYFFENKHQYSNKIDYSVMVYVAQKQDDTIVTWVDIYPDLNFVEIYGKVKHQENALKIQEEVNEILKDVDKVKYLADFNCDIVGLEIVTYEGKRIILKHQEKNTEEENIEKFFSSNM